MFKAQASIRVEYPKNFKGFKVQSNLGEFGTPNLNLYSHNMRTYILQKEHQNQDYVNRPSQYGKTKLDFQLGFIFLLKKISKKTHKNSSSEWSILLLIICLAFIKKLLTKLKFFKTNYNQAKNSTNYYKPK
jgi:hypothetical protein